MSESKVVVLTGGTFGIGREIAIGLAERGHTIVAFGLDTVQASSVAEASVTRFRAEAASRGLSADVLEADVSKAADVSSVMEFAREQHGRIDALVNNAAIGPLGTVLDTDEATFDRIISVNLKGAYLCSRAVIPHLQASGGGSIVNIGSGAGWGKPNMAAYAASKGGLFALAAATAYDFFDHQIRVNTVVPGGGGIISGIAQGRAVARGTDGSALNAPGSVAARPVTGADVSNTVAFLLSDEAETISGTIIDVGCFAHQGGPLRRKVGHD